MPHQLIMTATPIPRTLAMTAYADLDCSVIGELPPGRQPVKTVVLPEQRRAELVERVAAHCAAGQQAYWVCPLIEESELVDSRAASELERELKEALPSVRVGLIHGRMKSAEKELVMRAFKAAEIDLLVATTVIEVGVDVPNATLMVVENAERMGLAQLHQLRGRVGRGAQASSCVLLYKPPLSDLARERLQVLRATNDGFAVAQKDLELRGPGEVLGTRQTGIMQLRVADLLRDADLLPQVIEISEQLLATAPDSVEPLIRRWIRGEADYAKGLTATLVAGRARTAPRIAAMRSIASPNVSRRHAQRRRAPSALVAPRAGAAAALLALSAAHAPAPADRHLATAVADVVGAMDRLGRPARREGVPDPRPRHDRGSLGRLRHQRLSSIARSIRTWRARPIGRSRRARWRPPRRCCCSSR